MDSFSGNKTKKIIFRFNEILDFLILIHQQSFISDYSIQSTINVTIDKVNIIILWILLEFKYRKKNLWIQFACPRNFFFLLWISMRIWINFSHFSFLFVSFILFTIFDFCHIRMFHSWFVSEFLFYFYFLHLISFSDSTELERKSFGKCFTMNIMDQCLPLLLFFDLLTVQTQFSICLHARSPTLMMMMMMMWFNEINVARVIDFFSVGSILCVCVCVFCESGTQRFFFPVPVFILTIPKYYYYTKPKFV